MRTLRRCAASAARARYVTSVCTGSLLLGAAGLLHGKRAACHWAFRELLSCFGAIPDSARVVRDGNIITGGGVTAGIDMAFTVLAEIAGRELRRGRAAGASSTRREPPFDSGRPEDARVPRCRASVQAALRRAVARAPGGGPARRRRTGARPAAAQPLKGVARAALV